MFKRLRRMFGPALTPVTLPIAIGLLRIDKGLLLRVIVSEDEEIAIVLSDTNALELSGAIESVYTGMCASQGIKVGPLGPPVQH
jgi:hypothetical protein